MVRIGAVIRNVLCHGKVAMMRGNMDKPTRAFLGVYDSKAHKLDMYSIVVEENGTISLLFFSGDTTVVFLGRSR